MQLKEVSDIAVAICYGLQPYCERINIAGSIRRKKAFVKDIEICCVPKRVEQGQPDMFSLDAMPSVVDPDFFIQVMKLGQVLKGKPDGRYMQIALPQGINLDLFMPERDDYFRQYAIRTGSADYSAKVIAAAWVRKGWCGTSHGLRMQLECAKSVVSGKTVWTPRNSATLPPVWESEQAFFEWLEVPYLHPTLRIA